MIHVGFTGTRHGMTAPQYVELRRQLLLLCRDGGLTFHHGDCVGADAEFHAIARAEFSGRIVGHLPVDEAHRARCIFDDVRAPLTHMKRNRAIVEASTIMFAAPFDLVEPKPLVGGTWKTIGMARIAWRGLVIVLPNGDVREEREVTRWRSQP